jgi:hypothetical protein
MKFIPEEPTFNLSIDELLEFDPLDKWETESIELVPAPTTNNKPNLPSQQAHHFH